ncbi:hypothetical protein Slin15195_G091280 [Septoria linicola]|uniref:Uncharacterized protein n=1 Tax=Septoria linicola TaxID=215465 RepID=A0A9Q9AVT8_9PEZI|nr:hypothetical protein Slin15195_G091280 [Septoria linicola]
MPPPLCTLDGKRYLQATVYTPTQQPRSRKLPKMSLKLPNIEEKKSREALLLLIECAMDSRWPEKAARGHF